MLLNISGTTTNLTAGSRIGYATLVRIEFKNSNCKLCTDEVDIESYSYPNKVNSVESFYTDDGLSSYSNFPSVIENAAPAEESAVPKIEHLKLSTPQYKALEKVLKDNEGLFSKNKRDIGCCNFTQHQIDLIPDAVPHREGARRMAPWKEDNNNLG